LNDEPGGPLLPPDVMEIGITEVLLGENEIGIESSGNAKFFNCVVPVAVQGVCITQVIMRPRFIGRFLDRVGPK